MKTSMVQPSRKRLRTRASKNRLGKSVSAMKASGSILVAGKKAPNFSVNSTPDQKVSLSDFRGQPVVLAFYPADWSPVCTDQLSHDGVNPGADGILLALENLNRNQPAGQG